MVAGIGSSVIAVSGGGGVAPAASAAEVPQPVVHAVPSRSTHDLPFALRVAPRRAAPAVPTVARKAAHAAPRPVHRRTSTRRWLPTGTGMWVYEWKKTNGGHAATVVAKARAAGLSTLFVRTGSSHDGYTGTPVLRALLPATRGTTVHVVAWDFPELDHPAADARRLAAAARYRTGGNAVSAVAPDIETRSEGAASSPKRVSIYLSTLRRLLPRNVAILTTVPWPSSSRVGRYPYKAVAARSDALLPMAYWYDNSPTEVTATSISFLRRYKRPVQPVGQGYDGKLDVPSIPHNNLRKQMPKFFVTARKLGASAVSIWSWQAAPPIAWGYVSYAAHHGWYAPHH